jgi:hypothetical protein
LISFGVDGVNVFQKVCNGVICQMQDNYSPHSEGMHCMAHCTNMVVQTLFQIPIVKSIKDLLQSLYSFFFHNLKRHIEFFKLEELMKEKRKKNLWNVETCWINTFNPTKRVMVVYMPLLAKMVKDIPSITFAKMNFELICDINLLIFISSLLPVLEIVHALIKFEQKRNFFVCNYVVAIKIYKG